MPDFSRDPVEIPEGGKLIVALQEGTEKVTSSTQLEYVWLTAIGVYEQVTVSESKTNAGTTYATSNTVNAEKKETARQIANNITFTSGSEDYKVTATPVVENNVVTGWTYEVRTEEGNATTYTATVDAGEVVVKDSSNNEVVTTIENGLTAEEKEEAKTEVVDTVAEKEDLKQEENANARYWIDIAADEFAGGTGTESDPYLISSARQLALLAEIMAGYNTEKSYSNYCDKYYKLTKDIDLAGKVWISIGIGNNGSGINPFKGHIDGNNKTVYNMSSLDATYEELEAHKMGTWSTALGKTVAQDGFVGYAQDASVKNLYIVGAVFENSKFEKSGFIVCCAEGNTVLENCHVDSTSRYYGKSNIGGLVGLVNNNGVLILKNCSSAASITLTSDRGAGFVGALYSSNKIFATDCTFSGTINGNRIGGFIGRSASGMNSDFSGYHFKNCHMLGTLTPNTSGDYGYVEAWQADSTLYITLDGCTYKDATDGTVKAFVLTDEHVFGYFQSANIGAWFGVDEKLNDYPSSNTDHFPDASYSVDFENHIISYTIAENETISLNHKVCDFSRVIFIGHDGVEIIISSASNYDWSVNGNTQFFEEDGVTLFTGMATNPEAGIYWSSTKFAWDSTLNGWKLIAKNFAHTIS